ncbi:heme ABC exporter ATP-binding protein CcmA [Methylopila sp. 73B]|uniref:heme ABC exporter ATP-binding protein CcmA n=1 Tax=Methylopila sp. 73B TaxID=1120792 RepID=UPI000378ECD3|nr:heme ABC exporter ATP-binding protein CcmA [Methylopila sp. 73B]
MKLVVEGLGVDRGDRPVLRDLGFSLGAGEALAVLGPNGAGKSTLLRTIAGLIAPAAGRVALEGGDAELALREQTHMLGHLDAVKGGLAVRRNLAFARDVLGGGGDLDAALETVGLAHIADLPGSALSAGQRRRLALARLLAAPRPLWLLDEPTAALDAGGQRLLAQLMADHRAKGGLIVAATHAELGLPGAATLDLTGARPRAPSTYVS